MSFCNNNGVSILFLREHQTVLITVKVKCFAFIYNILHCYQLNVYHYYYYYYYYYYYVVIVVVPTAVAVVVIVATIVSATLKLSSFIIIAVSIISQMLLTFLAERIQRIKPRLASTRACTTDLVTNIVL